MKCKDCTVFDCQYRTTGAEKDCYYEQWTAKKSFDWQSFRAEAVKDILCALLNDNDGYHGDGENEMFVLQSIGIADELVKQLKEKEEK